MTDTTLAELRGLLTRKARTTWLIHSEPEVNYPPTIHSTHPLGNVGDPVEPLDYDDQLLIVAAINALPSLLSTIETYQARLEKAESLIHESLYHLRLDARAKAYHERAESFLATLTDIKAPTTEMDNG